MQAEAPKNTSPFLAMRVANYRRYWLSGLGMTGAQHSQRLAMAWLILDLTDSLGQLGLMVFVMGVPLSLVSLWGGVLADRYDRRLILILSQAFTGANLLVLAVLSITDLVEPWQVYVSSFGLGIAQALTMPARNALIRSLVGPDEIKNAVALNTVQAQTAQVVWPSIAGGVISLAGVGASLATAAALSFWGILLLMLVRIAPIERHVNTTSPMRELIYGVKYAFAAPRVGTLMGMAILVGFLGLPYMSLAPGFAREVLDFSAGETGLLLMATGIGAIIGSVFALVAHVRDNLRLYFTGSALLGLSVAGVALAPLPLVSFLPAAGFGFCLSIMIVGGQTLFQTEVPQELLGRVTSIWSLVAGIGFVAAFPIGMLGDVLGIRYVLGASGLGLLFLALGNGLLRTSVLRPGRVMTSVASPS